MKYFEKDDNIEKRYLRPVEASKILGVSQAMFHYLAQGWGYKGQKRYTIEQINDMAKLRKLRKLLKNYPYSFELKQIISKLWETKQP